MAETPLKKNNRLPLIFTVSLVAIIGLIFVYVFVVASTQKPEGELTVLTAESYLDIVQPMLVNASAERGEQLVTVKYECHVCHVENGTQIAPLFVGIAARAGSENPPLTAEAYLYESIAYPTAHIVEGYSAAMPANYPTRLTQTEFGDIIAYLLTQ